MLADNAGCVATLVAVPLLAWAGVLSVGLLIAAALVLGTASVVFTTERGHPGGQRKAANWSGTENDDVVVVPVLAGGQIR
jgi:hypothetical protein